MNVPAVRDFARLPCRMPAHVEQGEGRRQLEAVVRDISLNGARLEGKGLEFAPHEICVAMQMESGAIDRRPARIVWRQSGVVGVFFTDGRSSMPGFPAVESAIA